MTQISCLSTSSGLLHRERISRFKRTEQFLPEDYDLLQQLLSYFQKLVTTPNILTEVNSLANQLSEPERSRWFTIFAQSISILDEFYIKSKAVATNEKFTKFGLTDCGILNLAKAHYLVLTDDLKLAVYLEKEGINVINFNNLRIYGWR